MNGQEQRDWRRRAAGNSAKVGVRANGLPDAACTPVSSYTCKAAKPAQRIWVNSGSESVETTRCMKWPPCPSAHGPFSRLYLGSRNSRASAAALLSLSPPGVYGTLCPRQVSSPASPLQPGKPGLFRLLVSLPHLLMPPPLEPCELARPLPALPPWPPPKKKVSKGFICWPSP